MSSQDSYEALPVPTEPGGELVASITQLNPRENEGFLYDQPTSLYSGVVDVRGEPIKWTLEVPQLGLAYDGVAGIISGYGGIKQTSRAPRHALAKRGVATYSSEPARGQRLLNVRDMCDIQRLHTEAQVAIAADMREHQADITKTIPNGNLIELDKKLLAPHSMGGAPAVGYAKQETGAVDMIVNLATIGRGAPRLTDIASITPAAIIGSIQHELLPAVLNADIEISLVNLRKIIRYYTRMRAVFEALSCTRLDFREAHQSLHDAGIAVRSIDFEHDILVPTPPENVDRIMRNAGHLAPQCKADKVAQEILFLEQNREPTRAFAA